MSTITTTTLSTALGETNGQLTVASATGITGPGVNKTTRTVLWIDREAMEVTAVAGTVISVVRGYQGTLRVPHLSGATVWIGADDDLRHFMNMGLGIYSSLSRGFVTTTPTTAIDTATLTALQLLSGLITGTPTAAANYTFPTATLLIAALQSFCVPFIGQSFEFSIKNTSGGANTITAVAGTGVTLTGTATVAQNAIKRFLVVITGVDAPAYTVYSLGSSTF